MSLSHHPASEGYFSDEATLWTEIYQQPDIISLLMDMPDALFLTPEMINYKSILAVAEGSSLNCLGLVTAALQSSFECPVLTLSSDALLSSSVPWPNTFNLAVSQSGKTKCLIQVFEQIPLNLCITNTRHSPLVTLTNRVLSLPAGDERSIAATKTVTATLLTLLRWAEVNTAKRQALSRELSCLQVVLPGLLQQIFSMKERVQQFVAHFSQHQPLLLLSCGAYALALQEARLKFIEISRVWVEAFNTESFKHGYKALLGCIPVPAKIYVLPPEPDLALTLLEDVHQHFYTNEHPCFPLQDIYWIRFGNSPALPEAWQAAEDHCLTLPVASGWTAILCLIVAFQMMAVLLAERFGYELNHPGLQKSIDH